MSIQHVNLYLPELRPQKEWVTANTIVFSSIGLVLILSLTAFMMNKKNAALEDHASHMESQLVSSKARVDKITNRPKPNTFQLDKQLAKLKKSVFMREQVGQIIQGQNLGNEKGFSSSMNAMATEYMSSISLNRIRISRGGNFVEMQGVTRKPEDVPHYIQKLQQRPEYSSALFGLLSVTDEDSLNRAGVHEFALGFESLFDLAAEGGEK